MYFHFVTAIVYEILVWNYNVAVIIIKEPHEGAESICLTRKFVEMDNHESEYLHIIFEMYAWNSNFALCYTYSHFFMFDTVNQNNNLYVKSWKLMTK